MGMDWLSLYDLNTIKFKEFYRPDAEYCITEMCGRQRKGKSTLAVATLKYKLLSPYYSFGYVPDDVYANFMIYVPGVHSLTNEGMIEALKRAKKESWTHKVFIIDEASQPPLPLYARGYKDPVQTELVTSFWQMPKKGTCGIIIGNVGNSIDVQARDSAMYTIVVLDYYKCPSDREQEKIEFGIIYNFDRYPTIRMTFNAPAEVQKLFNSFRGVN